MIPIFPKQIALKGILIYFVALVTVCIVFFRHTMPFSSILMGVIWVITFFLFSSRATKRWAAINSKRFAWILFAVALALRIFWVFFSFYFYKAQTGVPFEFDAADSMGYHEEAWNLSLLSWKNVFEFIKAQPGVSDVGYTFYLQALYRLTGPSIIIPRIIKAILSAATCVLVYLLSRRAISESTGRMAAIFCVFMPNLIIYCGMHLKETEMIFLIMAFLERADNLIRSRKFSFLNIAITFILGLSLFYFRTVLGVVAILALLGALLFSSTKIIGTGRKILVALFAFASIASFSGGTIATEVEGYWEVGTDNSNKKRDRQESQGSRWAKYATGAVLAPMAFVMPFSTMVDTNQYNQQVMGGGNFVRNFFGIFVLLALYLVIFKEKNWREYSLLGIFIVGYLGVISVSGYGNSERFLLPGLPCLLILTAYGISKLNAKSYKFVKLWYIVVVIMEIAWAYFKLGNIGEI